MWSPGPQQLTVLWSDAPSSGTACSLELSLPSPAGIWFKTPLPVGGANTAELPPESELVSRHSGVKLLSTSEAGSVGVANDRSGHGIPTKPVGVLLSDLGYGDPCLRLTGHAVPDCPKVVLHPSLGPRRQSASKLRQGPLSPTLQPEWNRLPEGVGRVMRTIPLLTTFFFFFFFCQEGSWSATSLWILDSKEGSGLPAPNEIPIKRRP